ncbi:scavenger receptor cysteine-rich domain-containing protein DMBT1-like [Diadema antillarum]|uniref:scavenger receptor cysteine-rich domain-containing protein DMBT1-like n=1 Tax=Diadema antillarum TaxID=105358 RepID=UPI003A837F5D
MLGFERALEAPCCARFGEGSGRILMSGLNCDGTESSLINCSHVGFGHHDCGHSKDAGVICTNEPQPKFDVRLVGSTQQTSGRVEILYNGEWGSICRDNWGYNEASVVCRMLRYGASWWEFFDTPRGTLNTIMSDVECTGYEENIADCQYTGSSSRDCNEVAYDVCQTQPRQFHVRLVGGSNEREGRVEVSQDGDLWGTVCDDMWGMEEANITCRLLGYDGALESPCCARFGRGSGGIFLDNMECMGKESHLAFCQYPGFGGNNCRHREDAGVICSPKPYKLDIRLANGRSDNEGRVEVLFDGKWGTVCDDSWDIRDANVICRMFGYVEALEAPCCAKFGRGSGHFLLDDVAWYDLVEAVGEICAQFAPRLVVVAGGPEVFQSTCDPILRSQRDRTDLDEGFLCRLLHDVSSAFAFDAQLPILPVASVGVRLVDGKNEAQGRVEIFNRGEWGTVCDDYWDMEDANVVLCRMLGYQGAWGAPC